MKRSCFSEAQIIAILTEHNAGVSVADLRRKHVVSYASMMEMSEAKRLKSLEERRHG